MTTSPVVSVTDELVAELEALASKVGAMALDSAEEVVTQSGRMIECPVCHGEGYASAENDYCNFDNHAIGVEFYGIGPEFGLAEAYFRKANPATILALLAERAELLRKAEVLQLYAPIIDEIDRRAGKQHCIQDQRDFTVTISYEDYAAIAAYDDAQRVKP